MELPPPRYSEACKDSSPIIVTIDAECASIAQGNGYGQQELSENCLTVLAQGGADSWDEENEGLSFDDALTKYVGQFGKGQMIYYVAGSLLWVPNAVLILLLVFALGSPVADKAWRCTDPSDSMCSSLLQNPDPAAVTAGFCAMQQSQWAWTDPGSKVVSRFGLVCGEAWKAQVANSFFFVGYFIGSGLFGTLADKVGRKPSSFGASALAAVFTAAALGATNYWTLLAMRLLAGIGVAGQALGAYLLSTEMIGPAWRGVAGILTQCFFILGEFVLVAIAVALPSWRAQFTAGALLCAASLLLWFVVPESGRWLQVQGRGEEAYQSLVKLAALNGTRPPQEPLALPPAQHTSAPPPAAAGQPDASGATAAAVAPPRSSNKQGLGAALSDAHIARRFFILAYVWCVMCMSYYGISFALGGLGGSLVTSFSVASLAELPSYLLAAWAIERLGRHNTMALGLLLGGIACIGCAVTPAGAAQTVLAAVGKFGIAGSFAIASIFTSELFPTLIRSAVLGYQNQAARLGGIIAPFIVMGGSSALVPFITFGVAAVLAGLLVFTLPETLGVPLPDTMQDMGAIGSIFTHKTWQRGGMSAATKSMFKTRVNFTKPAQLPVLQESTGSAAASLASSAAPSPVPPTLRTPTPTPTLPLAGGSSRQALLAGGSEVSA